MAESVEVFDPQSGLREDTQGSLKHCRSCWREDIHVPVSIPPFALGFLLVFTLGLVLFLRPSRCVCCGKIRWI